MYLIVITLAMATNLLKYLHVYMIININIKLYFSLQLLSSNLYVNFQVDFDAVTIGNVQDKLITRETFTGTPQPFQVEFIG